MKKLFMVVWLLLVVWGLPAIADDTVYLKNGDTLRGTIAKYEAGKFIEITTIEGTLILINWDQIETVQFAEENPPKTTRNNSIKGNLKEGLTLDATLPSETLRLYWQQQGGWLRYSELCGNYVMTTMDNDSLGMNLDGYGFGLNAGYALLGFSPPRYSPRKIHAVSFKLGLTFAYSMNAFESSMNFEDSTAYSHTEINTDSDILITTMDFGASVGVNVGLGFFSNSQTWRGVILGAAWRPSFNLQATDITSTTTISTEITYPYTNYYFDRTTSSSHDFITQASMGGLEFSADFGSIKALTAHMTKRSALKLTCLYIPPLGDSKLSMLYLGIGVGIYR